MLACARIGAVTLCGVWWFSPDSLASRIDDSQAKVVITADSECAGKPIPLKRNVDAALNLPDRLGTKCDCGTPDRQSNHAEEGA